MASEARERDDANRISRRVLIKTAGVAAGAVALAPRLAAVRWIGEPVRAVRVRHDVVGRVEPLAVEAIGDHRDRAVVLVAHHAAG